MYDLQGLTVKQTFEVLKSFKGGSDLLYWETGQCFYFMKGGANNMIIGTCLLINGSGYRCK